MGLFWGGRRVFGILGLLAGDWDFRGFGALRFEGSRACLLFLFYLFPMFFRFGCSDFELRVEGLGFQLRVLFVWGEACPKTLNPIL